MSNVYQSLTELIGNTPMLHVLQIEKELNLKARLLVKLEYFNPAGSVKDRIARNMLETAEAAGALKPGGTIIEPTSGNTGIGLAALAAAKGYKAIFVMPESMSVERRKLLKGYGAQIVLTDAKAGMTGAIAKAEALKAQTPGAVIPGQFVNPANPAAHEETTGPEIWRDTEGQVDAFVAGAGTGGTVSGVGRYLKSRRSDIFVAAVEPASSPVLSGGQPGPHKIQGIGAGFVPETLDRTQLDEIIPVEDADALQTARLLARREGILTGISSGAALWAAIEVAGRPAFEDKTVVALLPDTGERYLSTALFKEA